MGPRRQILQCGVDRPGRLQATKKQLALLRQLDRRSYENRGLTVDQASELIEKAYERRAAERAALTPFEEKFIEALWIKAIKEANRAGDEWLKAHPNPQLWLITQITTASRPAYMEPSETRG